MTSFLCQSSGVIPSCDGKQNQRIHRDLEEDFYQCPEKQLRKSHYLFFRLYRKKLVSTVNEELTFKEAKQPAMNYK